MQKRQLNYDLYNFFSLHSWDVVCTSRSRLTHKTNDNNNKDDAITNETNTHENFTPILHYKATLLNESRNEDLRKNVSPKYKKQENRNRSELLLNSAKSYNLMSIFLVEVIIIIVLSLKVGYTIGVSIEGPLLEILFCSFIIKSLDLSSRLCGRFFLCSITICSFKELNSSER